MIYYGVIQKAFPPGDPHSNNKYQYEYMVLVNGDGYSQITLNHCLLMDEVGSADNFNDRILQPGMKVAVMCFGRDLSSPFIVGAIRSSKKAQDGTKGMYWHRRFNKFEHLIDKLGNLSMTSDSGPNLHIKTDKIIIDDSAGEQIILDKAAKLLTINANELKVVVNGKASISVTGDTDIKCQKNANITVADKCVLKAGKLDANIDGECNIKAGGNVNVDGSKINLNGKLGEVMTTGPLGTQPMCYVSGIPFQGSKKVKAGP